LARHYGFPAEELDVILNYDTRLCQASARQVKYRLSLDTETEEIDLPIARFRQQNV
jgi:hypothetical protein